jgi:uracil-DNA glycosylase
VTLDEAAAAARACTLCAAHLPLGPRPVLRVAATARLLVIGQAPGTRVHATGIPWNDASGTRLRAWLGIGAAQFYDAASVAILPAGLCYPGRLPHGGDAPPRPECAPTWHNVLRPLLTEVQLTLLVGGYAQRLYFWRGSVTETVAAWRDAPVGLFPLPHPSWRTLAWARKNPWFEAEVLPALRQRLADVTPLTTGAWPGASTVANSARRPARSARHP